MLNPSNPIPVAILIRVSTHKQESARQLAELSAYADAQGYHIVAVCKEVISGKASHDLREGLQLAEQLAQTGVIKKVLVHEISRLGRKNSIVHRFVEKLESFGVSLYWHAQSIETLRPDGGSNPAARIMLSLLAEMARAEVETLRDRVISGLAQARRNGITLGRPKGSSITAKELVEKHADIVKHLRKGQSIRHTAAITRKGISTVQRVKASLIAIACN